MSIQAVSWAIEDAPDVPPHLVATLIGIANHADRHGLGAYPSHATLAHYIRKDDRSVRRDLDQLMELGLIRLGDQRFVLHLPADKRPVVYDLAMERLRPPRPTPGTPGRPAKPQVKNGGTPTSGGTPTPNRGDAHVQNGGTPTSYKPSFDPSVEPPPPPSSKPPSPPTAEPKAEEEEVNDRTRTARDLLDTVQQRGRAPARVGGAHLNALTARTVELLRNGWPADALADAIRGDLAAVNSVYAVILDRLGKVGAPPTRRSTESPLARCPNPAHGGQRAGTCSGCAGDAKARRDEQDVADLLTAEAARQASRAATAAAMANVRQQQRRSAPAP